MTKKRKILIVDDEPTIREGLSKALHKFCDFQGEVKTVVNGKDALKEVSLCFYDICFLDVSLPDLSGIEVMGKINAISPNTRVVIMTASVIDGEIKRTIEEKASLFIAKPLDLSQIRVFVNHVLEGCKEEFIDEKRQFERRPFKKTINYSVNVFDAVELLKLNLKADTIDISKAGMGIWTDYPLEPGYVLRLNDNDIERIAGVVEWSKMVDDSYRAGIKFV